MSTPAGSKVIALKDRAEELKARSLEYAGTATSTFARGNEFLRSTLDQQPARVLGIAFGVGVALGWLIKRR